MEVLLIVSAFLMIVGFLIKVILKFKDFGIKWNEDTGFKMLLGWVIFGFLTRLDYTTAAGCLSWAEPILEPRNILFSTISFLLIIWAFKTKNINTRKIIIGAELIYWVTKLMIFKGGYNVGFGSVPDITIVFYDLIAIALRFFVLIQLFDVQKFKFIKIGIFAFLVLTVRAAVLPAIMNLDIPCFDYSYELDDPLIGYWEVVDASKEPFPYVYCEDLYIGTKFVFDYQSRMFIYRPDEERPCTDWKFGYAYKDTIIETWQGDVIMNLDILRLTNDTMKIKLDGDLTLVRID